MKYERAKSDADRPLVMLTEFCREQGLPSPRTSTGGGGRQGLPFAEVRIDSHHWERQPISDSADGVELMERHEQIADGLLHSMQRCLKETGSTRYSPIKEKS